MKNETSYNESMHLNKGDKIEFKTFVDGKACPAFPVEKIDQKLARQLKGYLEIQRDLNISITNIDLALMNDGQGSISRALIFSAVIAYARCFAQAEKGRGIKLERDWHQEENRDIHDSLINIRNQYIAHSGETELEQTFVSIILSPDLKNKKYLGIANNHVHAQLYRKETLVTYKSIIIGLLKKVEEKLNKLQTLIDTKCNEIETNHLYEMARKK